MLKKLALAGVLALGVGTVAQGVTVVAAKGHPSTKAQTTKKSTKTPKNAAGLGAFLGRHVLLARVNSVDAATGTITATTRGNKTITINTGPTTQFAAVTPGVKTATVSTLTAVHKDVLIGVLGTRTAANTFLARVIALLPPLAAGKVTNVQGTAITVSGILGTPQTIHVDAGTTFVKTGNVAGALTDVVKGVSVTATGTLNGDGSLQATTVQIKVPRTKTGETTSTPKHGFHVAGVVSGLGTNGSFMLSVHVRGANGHTTANITVTTTGSTTFRSLAPGTAGAAPTLATTSIAAVQTGVHVLALGTFNADRTVFQATQVVILPAGAKHR